MYAIFHSKSGAQSVLVGIQGLPKNDLPLPTGAMHGTSGASLGEENKLYFTLEQQTCNETLGSTGPHVDPIIIVSKV